MTARVTGGSTTGAAHAAGRSLDTAPSRVPAVIAALAAAIVLGALVLVTAAIATLVAPAASELVPHLVNDGAWNPGQGRVSAWPFVYGTAVTSALALAFAVPGGLGVALFLTDLGPVALRRPVETTIQVLAAIPSVVYGLWGARALAPVVREVAPLFSVFFGTPSWLAGPSSGFGYLTTGLVLALMVIPTIATVAREVLLSVPGSLREGALALGATPSETLRHVILPHARSGLVAAVMLGFARAASESIAVAMVIGSRPTIGRSLLSPGYTIASVIANEFAHAQTSLHEGALAALGLVLLAITIVVNGAARLLARGRTAGLVSRRRG